MMMDEGHANAQPGWYDAGVPGRLRWWDGMQWTAHERAVDPTPADAVTAPAAAPMPHVATRAPMGWYPVTGTPDVRWWDGAVWTPYRLRAGAPRADAFANEPSSSALTMGFVFIVLAISQFSTAGLGSGQPMFRFTSVMFLIAGVLALIGGFRTRQLSGLPAPSAAPVFDASTRPLPGEVEGAGSGWFAVSGQITRWWTGTRWSPYVNQKFGVRPTQQGARAYRMSMVIGGVFAGLGLIAAVLGFVLIYAMDRWTGVAVLIPGLIAVLVGGLVLVLTYVRRYTLILPPQAPPLS